MFDNRRSGLAITFLVALALTGGASAAHAEMMKMKATLAGTSEVPPNTSKGQGQATFDYDSGTKKLTWNISYSGLTGPATAGHIHGPAAANANAGVAIPFAKPASPITGSATLTEAQAADLVAGRMYVNIHTAAHPGGEIRGQIGK
ncbi:CHRD domain-containing protein [Vineibacter terrae]|uniref:CHRD domain-containing protein n=1 Tax=Vineibacter terrae TaxID=2586908 RepID=A0A5C8PGE2_9HYPH|nr:CHRD domain-containing protein [Vineibacter terrae]TXL72893.1 CHRD domain-containing protein [Vineibacter terrae]